MARTRRRSGDLAAKGVRSAPRGWPQSPRGRGSHNEGSHSESEGFHSEVRFPQMGLPRCCGLVGFLPAATQRPVQAHRRLQPGGALLYQAVLALEPGALGVEQVLQGDGAGFVAGLGQLEG